MNVFGQVAVTKAVLPFIRAGRGRIVFIGSIGGKVADEARTRYAKHIAAIRKGIEMQDRQGLNPDQVAAAVEHALTSRRPKTRYLVGTDARVQALLVRWLPDRPREAIIRPFAGP